MTTAELIDTINKGDFSTLSLDSAFWSDFKSRNYFNRDGNIDVPITQEFFRWFFSLKALEVHRSNWIDDYVYNLTLTKYKPTLDDMELALQYIFVEAEGKVKWLNSCRDKFYKSRNKPSLYFNMLWEMAKTNNKIEIINYELRKDEVIELRNSDTTAYNEVVTFYHDTWLVSSSSSKYRVKPDAMVEMIGKEKFKKGLFTKGMISDSEYFDDLQKIMTDDEMIELMEQHDGQVHSNALKFFDKDAYSEEQLEKILEVMKTKLYGSPYLSSLLSQYTAEQLLSIHGLDSEKLLLAKDGVENVLEEYLRKAARYNSVYNMQSAYSKLATAKFVREEDIIKYVKYIDPEAFKSDSFGYITQETFKLMNKASGKRQRWDENLSNFREVLYKARYSSMNVDDFVYLVNKTNASNLEILKALPSLYFSESTYPNLKIRELARLFKGAV